MGEMEPGATGEAFRPLEARADAMGAADRIALRGFVVETEVGAFHDERGSQQRLSFDVVVEVAPPTGETDDVDGILSYDVLARAINGCLAARRADLLETLAEEIAARILTEPQALRVFLRIEKLDRGPGRLGIEIVRRRGQAAGTEATALPAPLFVCVPPGGAARFGPTGRPVFYVALAEPLPTSPSRRLALIALDRAAWLLALAHPELPVVASRTEIDAVRAKGGAAIWAPQRLALARHDAPRDGGARELAEWLAHETGGEVAALTAAPRRLLPVPQPGSEGGLPLAGSRFAAWARARMPGGGELGAGDLSADERALLTGRRPPICGLSLDRPRVMAILNTTPDSFSDGGDLGGPGTALARARELAAHSDILDIGGESTRPGAEEVPVAEEIARTVPLIAAIRAAGIATPISIDTRKAEVAAAALDAGADMVNDVSAMRWDSAMAGLVAERGVPICLMHAKGDPRTMQDDPRYDDVVAEVHDHLAERIAAAEAAGIAKARILADPGIGFGKTLQHNLRLLRALPLYHGLGCALLLGASRKRFIGTLGEAPVAKDRGPGSLAVALQGAAAGVQVLRVHDARETRQALLLWQALAEPAEEQENDNGA